jgi:hypothetical protein
MKIYPLPSTPKPSIMYNVIIKNQDFDDINIKVPELFEKNRIINIQLENGWKKYFIKSSRPIIRIPINRTVIYEYNIDSYED